MNHLSDLRSSQAIVGTDMGEEDFAGQAEFTKSGDDDRDSEGPRNPPWLIDPKKTLP